MYAEIRSRGSLGGLEEGTGLYEGIRRWRERKHRRISAAPRIETHSVVDPVASQAVPPNVDQALAVAKELSREAGSKAQGFVAKARAAAAQVAAQTRRAESASSQAPTPVARKATGKAILRAANATRKAIKAGATAQKYKVAKGFAKMAAADLVASRKLAGKAKSAQRRNPTLAARLAKTAILRRDRGTMNLKRAQAAHSVQLAVPVPRGISQERLAAAGKKFGLRVRFAGKKPGQGAPAPVVDRLRVKGALGGLDGLGAIHGERLAAVASLYGLDGLGFALAAAELGEFGALGKTVGDVFKEFGKAAGGGAAIATTGVVTEAIKNKLGVSDESVRAALGVSEGRADPGRAAASPQRVKIEIAPQVSIGDEGDGIPWWGWAAGAVAGAAVLGGGAWLLMRRAA